MATLRPPRRSASPFGGPPPGLSPFDEFRRLFSSAFGDPDPKADLNALTHAAAFPRVYQKVYDAPANDAPGLASLGDFLLRHKLELEEKGLLDAADQAMERLFDHKTEVFLVDHLDKTACEKMGWPEEYRNSVLFAKERDLLIGGYFAPAFESNPGRFSQFITRWVESDNPDRLLHWFDFAMGSKHPTFEHYLLFTHPALSRVLRNKAQMKTMFQKARPVLAKLSTPTWEADVRKTLEF